MHTVLGRCFSASTDDPTTPPLCLSVDGDELNWLNPVDCEECLGDLEFVFEPRMCVESRASSLTEARRLMHRACKGRL